MVGPNVKVRSYMILVLSNVMMEQSNVRKKKKREPLNVMLVLSNVIIEPSNVREKKGTTKCDKRKVTCDIRTTQCEDETIKC